MDSPQTLLDQIHDSGIYALDAGDPSTTEDRAQQARVLRPQLQAIRDQARRAQAALRASKNEAISGQLTPYAYLEEMLDKLEIALRA
ncbi:MAG: hypothetical protein K8J31_25505, partial [Anaerolineae bacterium]|nr:hypothetical protein [Anaerolineae bacterium]